ncbi:MAG: hypothetical protein KF757_00335 [Phycisphaeraceae bacterium]|nr:hypothetical protein [Phycisphaeraceae bacterium]MCW5761655.1 hypothetical protein [Phycisphaeraceae bacterium]
MSNRKIEREQAQPDAGVPHAGRSGAKRRLRRWQIVVAAVALVVTLAGAGLMAFAALTTPEPAPRAATSNGAASDYSPFASGFAPRGEGDTGDDPGASADATNAADRFIDRYGGAVFKLGFGFFAGFAIGYLLRAFVKITLIVAGAIILGLFALQYFGVITVDWQRISGGFDTLSAWLGEQTKGFVNFVTGVLPSTAAGFAGAAVGFVRR